MGNNNICPICNKSGILDFLNEDVVCPCCGSDLSVYRKINALTNSKRNSNKNKDLQKWLLGVSVITCFFLILNIYLFSLYNNVSKNSRQLVEELEYVKKKNTKLSDLMAKLKESTAVSSLEGGEPHISSWYITRKGDSFCKISRRLYGTEAIYKNIIQLNNLTESTILHAGDSLRIK